MLQKENKVRPYTRAIPDRTLPAFYYKKQETLIQFPRPLQRAHMVRSAMIYRLNGQHELYDLQVDPDELSNQYENTAYASVAQDLQKRLLDFFVRYQTEKRNIRELYA